MSINDTHCHFFSSRFFELLVAKPDDAGPKRPGLQADEIAARIGWEAPGSAEALADRWVAELDRHGVSRAALIASIPGDEDSVAAAVARHPSRFVGFFMVNPQSFDAAARMDRALGQQKLRCICLFPAMHRYPLNDDKVEVVFQTAERYGAAVFIHCGVLSVGVRAKLGLPSTFDLRMGDPLGAATLASTYPKVPVIIPHFGAGFFREALMAASQAPNIHLDTSSSNSWMKYYPGLTLDAVFRQALQVAGAERLLFGTDSSFFPRGWQKDVYDAQVKALESAGASPQERALVLGENFDRIFKP